MHGLVNRAVQCFARDIYGQECWAELAASIGIGIDGFEAMLVYEDELTFKMVTCLAGMRGRSVEDILEDVGTYLITHENTSAIRRLLRFGGENFVEFLYSLDDLPDRVRLALPEVEAPELHLTEITPGRYTLRVINPFGGGAAVLAGILRALADDYGVLAFLEVQEMMAGAELLRIELLDDDFAEGKHFSLGPQNVGEKGAIL